MRYSVLALVALATGCAGHRASPTATAAPAGDRPAEPGVEAAAPAAAPASAAATGAAAASAESPRTSSTLPPQVVDSLIDVEIAAELRMAADSAADAAVLDQLAAVQPDGGDEGDGSAGGAKDVASTATWDFDVSTYASHDRVQYWLGFFQGRARDRFGIWLGRLPKYEPMIRERLKERELPTDLVYLALIESGMSNQAVSYASAVGMWQFMRGTARHYGLRVDSWVDERRDPFKATVAATRYLKDLYKQFGSLYLAAAAYNAGGGRISRSVKRLPQEPAPEESEVAEESADATAEASADAFALAAAEEDEAAEEAPLYSDATFFRLYDTQLLHRETRDYVPKLIAAALIAKEPERYGFKVPENVEPITYDSLVVQGMVGLDVVARLANTTVAAIRELNPQYLRLTTPPSSTSVIRLPAGHGARTAVAYAELPASRRVSFREHVVRRGETLSAIARRYGVSQRFLTEANPKIRGRKYLRVGARLVIPTGGQASATVARRLAEPEATERAKPVWHKVRRGESLSVLAQRYEVTERQLRSWNNMGRSSTIRIGQRLRIAAPGRATVKAPASAGRTKQRVATAAAGAHTHRVRRGETLSGVAQRYGVSLEALKAANGLRGGNPKIRAGSMLRIPARGDGA